MCATSSKRRSGTLYWMLLNVTPCWIILQLWNGSSLLQCMLEKRYSQIWTESCRFPEFWSLWILMLKTTKLLCRIRSSIFKFWAPYGHSWWPRQQWQTLHIWFCEMVTTLWRKALRIRDGNLFKSLETSAFMSGAFTTRNNRSLLRISGVRLRTKY